MPEDTDNINGQDDQQQDGDAQAQEAGQTQDDQQQSGRIEDLPDWAQEHIRELRSEAAERRLALRRHEDEAKQREQKRLAEQGQYKSLAEQRAQEINDLTPYRERAEALEAMIRDSNEKRIKSVREDRRSLIPTDYPPEKLSAWLDANIGQLTAPPAPDIDAGAGGGGGGGSRAQLTPELKAMAKRMNVSEESLRRELERDNKS